MLIKALNLGYFYTKDKFCFKDLSFGLNEDETLAILGLNGQGKSTLLYNLIDILEPKIGEVNINQSFSYLGQNLSLNFNYSVIDVVLMGLASKISLFKTTSKNDYEKKEKALEILGILSLKDRL